MDDIVRLLGCEIIKFLPGPDIKRLAVISTSGLDTVCQHLDIVEGDFEDIIHTISVWNICTECKHAVWDSGFDEVICLDCAHLMGGLRKGEMEKDVLEAYDTIQALRIRFNDISNFVDSQYTDSDSD